MRYSIKQHQSNMDMANTLSILLSLLAENQNRRKAVSDMLDFAETTKDMTAEEILNYYRNLYYLDKLCKKYTEEDKK